MNQEILPALLASLQMLAIGYIPAVFFGVVVGGVIGLNRIVYEIFKRVFQVPAAIPAIVLIPIGLMIFQQNRPVLSLVSFFAACWWIVLLSAMAMRQLRQGRDLRRQAIATLTLGLRIGFAFAWVMTIVAETLLSGVQGIGFYIWEAYQSGLSQNIWNGAIAVSVVGFLIDQVIDLAGVAIGLALPKSTDSQESRY